MGRKLDLIVESGDESTPVRFFVRRVINAGYVGRDRAAVQAHIEELSREGVPPPPAIPMIFPVLSGNITTDSEIEVIGEKTSGEAEFVLLLDQEYLYVGVGSDHTDRALESHSIVFSKQVCANVLSRRVWRYDEVRSHWDSLIIRSWVRRSPSDDPILYQQAPLRTILSADDLVESARSHISDGELDGLVIFSGTVPIVAGEITYADSFQAELVDEHLHRKLTCNYRIHTLDYLQEKGAAHE